MKNIFFYKNWFNRGIKFVNDLVMENGKFYKDNEIRENSGIVLNFIQYQGIINSLKKFISHKKLVVTKKLENPFIPSHLEVFLKQKSGTKPMYTILNKNNEEPTGKKTWNEKYHFTDEEWKQIYLYPFTIINYPAIQWFQVSIIHNILVTNKLLVKMQLKNDPHCYYCHSQEETIIHLFWTCEKIKTFLKDLVHWLETENIQCKLTQEQFIFGLDRNNILSKPLNTILLYAKYYIYTTRCNEQSIHLDIFKRKLIVLFKILKEISFSNNKLTEFYEDWNSYSSLLETNSCC